MSLSTPIGLSSTSMISQVLPGLRDFRTPFSTGVLWIIGLWLLLRGHVSVSSSSDIGRTADDVQSALEPLGLGLVLGLLAYLVGSALEFLWAVPLQFTPAVSRSGLRAINTLVRRQIETLPNQQLVVVAWSESLVARRHIERSVRQDEHVRAALERRVAKRIPDAKETASTAEAGSSDRHIAWTLAPDVALASVAEAGERLLRPIQVLLQRDLVFSVRDELAITGTRLLGKEQELFDTYDRLRGEAEFRFAMAAPLALAMVGLLHTDVPPIVLVPICCLVAGIFVMEGAQRRRAAGDRLADALLLGRVKAPSLEQVKPGVFTVAAVKRGEIRAASTIDGDTEHQILGVPWHQRAADAMRASADSADFFAIRPLAPVTELLALLGDLLRGATLAFRDSFQGVIRVGGFSLRINAERGQRNALISLGDIYHDAGDIERARDAYWGAARRGSALAYFKLGELEVQTGNRADAMIAFGQAAEGATTADLAQRARAALDRLRRLSE